MDFERGEQLHSMGAPPRRRLLPLARRVLWGHIQARAFPGVVTRGVLRRRLAAFLGSSARSRLVAILRSASLAGAAAAALLGTYPATAQEVALPAIELSAIARGEGGFEVRGEGEPASWTGSSVAAAGDVNGDGIPDLIVEGHCQCLEGRATGYVVFGKPGGEVVELVDVLAGLGGFAIRGGVEGRRWNLRVAGARDVNGDGLADILLGARYASPEGRQFAGESYVVFGKRDGEAVELRDVQSGLGGFAIQGSATYDYAGSSVAGAGDVNGDGLADVIVGAPGASPGGRRFAGESYVIFGKPGGEAVDLRDVQAGRGGFTIRGAAETDRAGTSVAGAGDVNGDGLADIIVGAPWSDPEGLPEAGKSYVVFGKPGGEAVALRDVQAGVGGFVIQGGVERVHAGSSVAGAGDVNGDGLADIIIGAPSAGPQSRIRTGESYVIFGKAGGEAVDLRDVQTGQRGFAIRGGTLGDQAGFSVAGAGDVNGDGLDDLVVGAPGTDPQRPLLVESYVVFGKAGGGAVEIQEIKSGRGGFAIRGVDLGDQTGSSVAGAGDVNGDGLADIIVGAPGASPEGRLFVGESHVVFGKPGGEALDLRDVRVGRGGFAIRGSAERRFASLYAAGAGDVNGDGLADIIAASPLASPGGQFGAGECYVVFGKAGGEATDLRDIQAGRGGFTIRGSTVREYAGSSVAGAGDVNGDGLEDLLVGAAGETHVVFGKPGGDTVDLGDIQAGQGGFAIQGGSVAVRVYARQSVAGAGDVNGDGLADLLVGDHKGSPPGGRYNAGESYVVLGKPGGDAVDLRDLQAARGGGFAIHGIAERDYSGYSIAGAGDVNGDGLADVLVGAYKASPVGRDGAGESYVVFGKPDGAAIELRDVQAGRGGFAIQGGAERDRAGFGVAGAGDVNGDGIPDLLIGAPIANPEDRRRAGESYVVFGRPGGEAADLQDIQADQGGFAIQGGAENDRAGWSVAGPGDVNGDGLADLLIDAPGADPGGLGTAGEGYVIFGKRGGGVDLQDIQAGLGGFAIRGGAEREDASSSVAGAGDVNGDGFPDVLVTAGLPGARHADLSGAAYVVFGFRSVTLSLFRRGAARGEDAIEISDAIRLLGWLLLGDTEPLCLDAADADDSGSIEIADAVGILCWLFLGDGEPPAPGPLECGGDPTPDEIECAVATDGCAL